MLGRLLILFFFVLFVGLCDRVEAQATAPAERGKFARQLDAECKRLMADAVRRPYGWGWEMLPSSDPRKQRSAQVCMEPGESPAAGLLLLWAGQLLDEPELRDAGRQAARGVAASMSRTGAVLRRPVFAASAGGHDEKEYVPRRDSTAAGLALLLAQLDASEQTAVADGKDKLLHSAAARATTWLIKQQARNGAWQAGFPPDAGARGAVKIQRLDDSSVRDSTFALLLAGEVLHDQSATHAAGRVCDLLVQLRLVQPLHSNNLWAAAYTIDGSIAESYLTFPGGADALSSRYTMQALLAGYVLTGEKPYFDALDRAAKALVDNRRDDGRWDRFPEPGPIQQPATQAIRPGATTQPAIALPIEPAGFGIDPVLNTIAILRTTSLDRFIEQLPPSQSPHHELAGAMAGLIDDPLSRAFPTTAEQADGFLKDNAELWKWMEGPQPEDLELRVKRLWALLNRAELEQRFHI